MKSTKVKTLGTVALHATTDCTDDAKIVGLGPLNWAIHRRRNRGGQGGHGLP